MTRLYLPQPLTEGKSLEFFGEKARYLSTVLRCRSGDTISVFNDLGQCCSAHITSLNRKTATIKIIQLQDVISESPLQIILLQGLLKGSKMDFVIQKATELGVHEIIPFVSERSDVTYTRKTGRWEKIAEEASRQSGRFRIPGITSTMNIKEALENCANVSDLKFLFWEEKGEPLQSLLSGNRSYSSAVIACGPEGGFSASEVEVGQSAGFRTATLGKRILRAETASLAALSILQYAIGDMGGSGPN